MNVHLKNYLGIYLIYPLNNYFTKEQRKNRHKMLSDWEKSDLQELPNLDELISFIRQNKNIIHITPQFFKKFEIVWKDDLKNGHQFAEFLIEMNLEELLWKFDISPMNMALQVLKHNPNHTKALELKLRTLIRYHDFTLHELPWGVLIDNDLEEELKSVDEMEAVAEKLGYKNEYFDLLLSYCETYYPLWFEYVEKGEKDGFENFLKSKGIDTERIVLPYIVI
ncbi:hypothetical protein HZY83_08070 [Gemella sp. GH3]|uniref:hypothetical protein n=1 Tax=unclassified Gemella TaxID=2624949 RepID=UPI0015D08A48|nr:MULTISPECIES: hypothetical protein [unclassified Gemella]MBF0714625.1 hypothetical protein [Gemella sp. GH3.1]NYS51577.1 hypothetical protein [Gemella sp. GH3]